jgi:type IV secretory pathway VirB9-like protein
VPPLPAVPRAVTDDDRPGRCTRRRPGRSRAAADRRGTPTGRVENANAAARVEPRREGYYNAIQIYPWSEGALYQVYAAPGRSPTSRWSRAKA